MDIKQLVRWLKDNDYEVVYGGTGHLKVFADGRQISSLPATPSGGQRSMQNAISQLRRAGVAIPRKGDPRR